MKCIETVVGQYKDNSLLSPEGFNVDEGVTRSFMEQSDVVFEFLRDFTLRATTRMFVCN